MTQDGQPRGGATVTVIGGSGEAGSRLGKRVKVSANGKFAVKFRGRERSSAPTQSRRARSAPAVCAKLQPLLGGIPCVNPTVSGFVAKSKVVKKK